MMSESLLAILYDELFVVSLNSHDLVKILIPVLPNNHVLLNLLGHLLDDH